MLYIMKYTRGIRYLAAIALVFSFIFNTPAGDVHAQGQNSSNASVTPVRATPPSPLCEAWTEEVPVYKADGSVDKAAGTTTVQGWVCPDKYVQPKLPSTITSQYSADHTSVAMPTTMSPFPAL